MLNPMGGKTFLNKTMPIQNKQTAFKTPKVNQTTIFSGEKDVKNSFQQILFLAI